MIIMKCSGDDTGDLYPVCAFFQEKLHSTLKLKDDYIEKLETEREKHNREMAYLYATNADLADQNKVCSFVLPLFEFIILFDILLFAGTYQKFDESKLIKPSNKVDFVLALAAL